MDHQRTCDIIDARAARHAWSKRRMLLAIIAAALAVNISVPAMAYAVGDEDEGATVATEHTALVVSPAEETDISAGASTGSVAAGDAAAVPDAASSTTGAVLEPMGAQAGETAEVTSSMASPMAEAAGSVASDAADLTPAGADSPADASATAQTATAQTGTGTVVVGSVSSGTVVSQTVSNADSLGTDIQFDYDQDGTTTQADWEAYRSHVHNAGYTSFDEDDRAHNRSQGMQEKVNGEIRDEAGATVSNLDVSNVHSYYLNNIGQATSVKNQNPWNDCWSFAVISALESSILKARAGSAGQAINAADHATPKLEGIDDHGVDLSELYYAWLAYSYNASGSQKGEGLSSTTPNTAYANDWEAHLNAGNGSYADYLFGAWRGIASEEDFPYLSDEFKAYIKNWYKAKGSDVDELWQFGNWSPLTKENFEKYDAEPAEQVGAKQVAHVDGVVYLPNPNKTKVQEDGTLIWAGHDDNADVLIKQALVRYGAVAVTLYADSDYVNYKTGGWYYDQNTCQTNHLVTIVGWNDDIDPSTFQATKRVQDGEGMATVNVNDVSGLRKGAWLVKNSWGSEDWYEGVTGRKGAGSSGSIPNKYTEDGIAKYGDQWDGGYRGTGYYWVSYYDRSLTLPLCFSVDDGRDGFDYQHNYSYDTAVIMDRTPFALRTDDDGTYVANVFQAEGDEILKAVSVRTSQPNSHARIWVYLVDSAGLADNDPTNDSGAVASFEYDATLAGLHTVRLPAEVSLRRGQRFAVVENVTSEETSGERLRRQSWLNLEMEVSQKAQDDNPAAEGYYRSVIIANDGETFARVKTANGYRWVTPKQLSQAILDGSVMVFGSAMVKAFTVDATQAMYRLYNPNSGEHFYTANTSERDNVVAAGWRYEGIGWTAPVSSNTPVYRLYSGTDHHYTTSREESDWLVTKGWKLEGIGWYSDDAMGVPLYRQFNPNVDPTAARNNSGSHNYTTSKEESDWLVSLGWRYEGIAWYGVAISGQTLASTTSSAVYRVAVASPSPAPSQTAAGEALAAAAQVVQAEALVAGADNTPTVAVTPHAAGAGAGRGTEVTLPGRVVDVEGDDGVQGVGTKGDVWWVPTSWVTSGKVDALLADDRRPTVRA